MSPTQVVSTSPFNIDSLSRLSNLKIGNNTKYLVLDFSRKTMNVIPKLSSSSSTSYPVADFYAGIVNSTFQLDARDELQNCMVPDQDLTALWDTTVENWTWGKESKWQKGMGEAL